MKEMDNESPLAAGPEAPHDPPRVAFSVKKSIMKNEMGNGNYIMECEEWKMDIHDASRNNHAQNSYAVRKPFRLGSSKWTGRGRKPHGEVLRSSLFLFVFKCSIRVGP